MIPAAVAVSLQTAMRLLGDMAVSGRLTSQEYEQVEQIFRDMGAVLPWGK